MSCQRFCNVALLICILLVQLVSSDDEDIDAGQNQGPFISTGNDDRRHLERKDFDELRRLNEIRLAAEAQRAIDAHLIEVSRKNKERLREENLYKEEHISRIVEAKQRVEEVRRKNRERELENENLIRKVLL